LSVARGRLSAGAPGCAFSRSGLAARAAAGHRGVDAAAGERGRAARASRLASLWPRAALCRAALLEVAQILKGAGGELAHHEREPRHRAHGACGNAGLTGPVSTTRAATGRSIPKARRAHGVLHVRI